MKCTSILIELVLLAHHKIALKFLCHVCFVALVLNLAVECLLCLHLC